MEDAVWKNIPKGWADMDEDEKKDAAYAKGQQDYVDCGGIADNPISEMAFPNYDPPDGYEEEYADGWNHAKSHCS